MSSIYDSVTDEQIKRQMDLEEECLGLGVKRYRQGRLPWQVKESTMPESERMPGLRIISEGLGQVAGYIQEWIDGFKQSSHGGSRRDKRLSEFVAEVGVEEAAFAALKTCVDSMTFHATAPSAARRVTSLLETQMDYARLKKHNKYAFAKVKEQLGSHAVRNRKLLSSAMDWQELHKDRMDPDAKVRLGMILIDFVCRTGIAQVASHFVGIKKTEKTVMATEKSLAWLEAQHEKCEKLFPVLLPMLTPPRPWTQPVGGGYLSDAMPETKLIRSENFNYIQDLGTRDLTNVYKAVNAVQATPWRINKRVYKVLKQAWDQSECIGKLPPKDKLPLPPRPAEADHDEEVLKQFKKDTAQVWGKNAKLIGKRAAAAQKLWIAERFMDEEAIWFPHSLDWRGRLYPIPHLLTPQGDDVAKGLLEFAKAKPLGEEGAWWLAVHTANTFGEDKIAFGDRVQWVHDNEEAILAIGMDANGYAALEGQLDWRDADKPFQFLAACVEWAGYRITGPEYMSRLPIAMDGSCSGLQHFSAMLRDPVGGAATNLLPAEKPQDIYQRVADVVNGYVMKDAQGGSDSAPAAKVWVGNVNRKVCKTPTMTLPYGVTKFGMIDQIHGKLVEAQEAREAIFSQEECSYGKAGAYLGGLIYDSVGEVVRAAPEAMGWLQKAAKVAAKDGLPVNWTTPAGLPIQQAYRKQKTRRIQTHFGGSKVKTTIREETAELDSRRQASGIAPNFVHSLDASHLMLTVCQASEHGIEDFAMIHDSFACHACDTGDLNYHLRRCFVDQYSVDRLAEFRDQLEKGLPDELREELPPLPEKGDLDLEQVMESWYFFA